MTVTLTTTEYEPPVRTRVITLRPRTALDDLVKSEADGSFTNETVVQEGSLEERAVVSYSPYDDWSVTDLALSTITTPFRYTYYSAAYLYSLMDSEKLSYFVSLFTARGVMGTINSTVGTCMGTFWGITCAELVSQKLISKTIAVGCAYLGKGPMIKKFITAGAYVIVGPGVETVIVMSGAIAGGMLLVLIGNCVYELSKEQHRELVNEWESVTDAVEE